MKADESARDLVSDYRGSGEQTDDVTLLLIEFSSVNTHPGNDRFDTNAMQRYPSSHKTQAWK